MNAKPTPMYVRWIVGCSAIVAAVMSTMLGLEMLFPSENTSKSWTQEEVMECVVLYETAIENETVKEHRRTGIAERIFNRVLPK